MFEVLRRDVRMVVDGLRGRSPSPLVSRGKGAVYAAVASDSAARARTMVVTEVVRETADAVTIRMRDRAGARIEWIAGQFLTVIAEVGGETLRRAYSITGERDGAVAITVKHIEGGRVSTWMTERVAAGMTLPVLGPSGEFTAVADAANARHVIAIAGGSGITPIIAIARCILAGEPRSRVTLLYGNRTEDGIIFRGELDALERDSGGRFHVRHVIGEAMDIGAFVDDAGAGEHYVCGPEPMMEAARAAFAARGITGVKEERFTAPARRQAAHVASAQMVTIRRAGVAMDVIVPAGETVLDAGLAAGVPMKLSCAMGGCGACAVRLTAGEVVMDEPNCLRDAERAKGIILACVARPITPCTVDLSERSERLSSDRRSDESSATRPIDRQGQRPHRAAAP